MCSVDVVQSPMPPLKTKYLTVPGGHAPDVDLLPGSARRIDGVANYPLVVLQTIFAEKISVLLMQHVLVLPVQNVRRRTTVHPV
ncbi:hypothetical protein CCR75_007645 [Bremia lactucae]|uniref:Uncharacterized protein n=1 Tax=Bremia lactucae TaxID=4779 RepID=A0A976NZA3_BRELC|nr:hypothetical protein CCR75_007645 [Bremia lactucae]